MIILAAENFISSISESFSVLMSARILGAIAHGLFWAMIGALAAKIAPPDQVRKATAVVFTGVSVASVLGVPIGTFLGQQFGWQAAFLILSLIFCGVMTAAYILLPKIPSSNAGGLKIMGTILKRIDLRLVYLSTKQAFT